MGCACSKISKTDPHEVSADAARAGADVRSELLGVDPGAVREYPKPAFAGMCGYAYACDVYDGDTCTLVLRYDTEADPLVRGEYLRVRVRMSHYDTAEMKSKKGHKVTLHEKALALAARRVFCDAIGFDAEARRSALLWYEFGGVELWGRPLAMLWRADAPARSVNAVVHAQCGHDYEGATKPVWDEAAGAIEAASGLVVWDDTGRHRLVDTSYDRPAALPR